MTVVGKLASTKRPLIEAMKTRLPDGLLVFSTGVLLSEEILRATIGVSFLKSASNDLRITVGIAALLFFIFTASIRIHGIYNSIASLSAKYLGVLEVLESHETVDFPWLLQQRHNIRLLSLSGTKAATLGDEKTKELLCDPTRRSKVTILLANPFSRAIISRYQADEPSTFEAGPDGIRRRLLWLYRTLRQLPRVAQDRIEVRVYDNYPVVSILQADKDIYSTAYGYKLRGGDCPKVHCSVDGDYGRFLCNHFEKVYADAMPLAAWVEKYAQEMSREI